MAIKSRSELRSLCGRGRPRSQLFGAHFAGTAGEGVGLSPQSDKPPHDADCGWLANSWPINWTCVGRPDDSRVSPNQTKVGHCGDWGTLSMVILQKRADLPLALIKTGLDSCRSDRLIACLNRTMHEFTRIRTKNASPNRRWIPLGSLILQGNVSVLLRRVSIALVL